jgi:isopenicillin-N N-acyltransferase like protein
LLDVRCLGQGHSGRQGHPTQIAGLGNTVSMQDIDGPFRNYPLAVVYHPSSNKYGEPWVNLGFVSWVGVISGVNSHQLGVSEIGVYFHDETFGKESRFGNPFTFVLRDILQWDKTLDESINRLKTTKRTCNLILGVGDGK